MQSFLKKGEAALLRARQNAPRFTKPVFSLLRALLLSTPLRGFRRSFLIVPEVVSVCTALTGTPPGRALIQEALSSDAFSRAFDRYHSGDFDVLLLYLLVRLKRPETVVETGISSGRSSTAILEALERNGSGTLYSIDLPKLSEGTTTTVTLQGASYRQYVKEGEAEPGWLVPSALKGRWRKILGDSNKELPRLAETLSSIDLFYHDSDHTRETMLAEFRTVWPLIPPGGVLLADDISASTAWQEFTHEVPSTVLHAYAGLGILKK